MLNSFFHIILVFVLCFTASTIPVNIDALDFLSLPSPSIYNKTEYAFHVEKNELENPQVFTIQISSESFELQPNDLASKLQLDIIQKDQVLSTLAHDAFIVDISHDQETEPQVLSLTINIGQKHLNLKNGNYILRIYSTAPELKRTEPVELKVKYAPLSAYIPAVEKEPRGLMGMTLYFSESSEPYMIPISRFAPYGKIPVRTMINNLREGSDPELGFGCPIPEIKKLQIRRDMVIVNLPKDLEEYNQDPTKGKIAVESLVNSLTALPGINQVKFLLNGKESDQIFHSYSTDMIFKRNNEPKIYLGMDRNKKRLLLIPSAFNITDENNHIQQMFSALKTAKNQGKSLPGLIASIPENVELINFSQNKNTLTLNISKEFLNAYPERPDLQRFMLDSILYSFTSLDGIDKVQVLVNNEQIGDFNGINLSRPLEKPKFINPEKE